jgi:hypothetical protein
MITFDDLDEKEKRLLAIYRSMDDAGKAWMRAYLKEQLKATEDEAAKEARRKRLTLVVSRP